MYSETKKVKLRQNYDVYSEKDLGDMHIVYHTRAWGFKYSKDIGVLYSIKVACQS